MSHNIALIRIQLSVPVWIILLSSVIVKDPGDEIEETIFAVFLPNTYKTVIDTSN